MARSLVVKHEEETSTSPLLTGFLLFAVLWMVLAAVGAGVTADAPELATPEQAR